LGIQNWLDGSDIENILNISGFEIVSTQKRLFGLVMITIARPKITNESKNPRFSVSIVIPARNEEGNISKIIPSIPKFGKSQEIIFIEGHSKDKTWEMVKAEERKRKNVKVFKQHGKGTASLYQKK